ncbi:hypothetical protein EZ449_09165 [Pedobacter frigidisoli]|uniref:Uncharacterized protein n=1 Tax=Pedobacter frigidisoli TaxID=2530455 RepID=A0A4R0P191_9SPHI|nr:hypothetical protein [Pedobacter frigidisoli]TCD10506.1 hypothetical protein EZ449_09165 [Pedobacter frigidisoli]
MKKYLTILIIFIAYNHSFSQEKLVKDIDFDGVKDTAYVDTTGVIVCQLSTNKFKKIKSKAVETYNDNTEIISTKNGFSFKNNWMRAGYDNQFRYNKTLKKVQLIGMSRYEFGNAANDGSGNSSVNLLTGDYLGDWNYFDHLANKEQGELVKIPTIKTKMPFKQIFLEDFSEQTYFNYSTRCANLFTKHKKIEMKRRSKN